MARQPISNAIKLFLGIFVLIITIILVFFIYSDVKFNKKINVFENNITNGMKEDDVIKLLGDPNYIDDETNEEGILKIISKRPNEVFVLIYNNHFVFRDDLRLYFDKKTKSLLYKSRHGMTFGIREYQ